MEGSSCGVGVHALAQEALVLHLLADEASRDGNLLAAGHHLYAIMSQVSTYYWARIELKHNAATHNVVDREDLLGHDGGQAPQHVCPGIDNDSLRSRAWEELSEGLYWAAVEARTHLDHFSQVPGAMSREEGDARRMPLSLRRSVGVWNRLTSAC